MSMPELLANLRAAHSLLPPGVFTAAGPGNDRLEQKALDSADYWLHTSFLKQFDAEDFPGLDADVRERVGREVGQFRRVAEGIPDGTRPTTEQRRQGLSALVGVLTLLRPCYSDQVGERLGWSLWDLEPRYPQYVLGFDCEFGTDWTGDPGVWVRIVVPDGTDVGTAQFDRFMDDVTGAARRWLDAAKLPHWPYTQLMTPSDIKDQIAEAVE